MIRQSACTARLEDSRGGITFAGATLASTQSGVCGQHDGGHERQLDADLRVRDRWSVVKGLIWRKSRVENWAASTIPLQR